MSEAETVGPAARDDAYRARAEFNGQLRLGEEKPAVPTWRELREAGRAAALAGEPITACPLDGRTVQGQAWRSGWKEGAERREARA